MRYPPEEVETWEAAQLVSSTSEEVAAGRRSHKVRSRTEPSTKPTKPLQPARRNQDERRVE